MKIKNILSTPEVRDRMVTAIYKRIPQADDHNDEETATKKEATLAALKEFYKKKSNRTVNSGTRVSRPFAPEHLRVSDENMSELLAILDMSYKDFFEIVTPNLENPSQPFILDWNSEIDREMCELCDGLSQEQRRSVLALCKDLLPQNVLNPSDNLHYHESVAKIIKDREVALGQLRNLGLQLKDKNLMWRLFYSTTKYEARRNGKDEYSPEDLTSYCTIFRIEQIPHIAKEFSLSIHWLMQLDEKTTVLARHGGTEQIMDLFCLLDFGWPSPEKELYPELNRKLCVLKAVRMLAGNN